jgi:hypothetical protein
MDFLRGQADLSRPEIERSLRRFQTHTLGTAGQVPKQDQHPVLQSPGELQPGWTDLDHRRGDLDLEQLRGGEVPEGDADLGPHSRSWQDSAVTVDVPLEEDERPDLTVDGEGRLPIHPLVQEQCRKELDEVPVAGVPQLQAVEGVFGQAVGIKERLPRLTGKARR